jgi:hypothetical protein
MSSLPARSRIPAFKVLVVENHADTRIILVRYLQALGHEVTAASGMNEGRALLGQSEYDIVLSDIGLDDGDGWELCQSIPSTTFAVAISGFGTQADIRRSLDAGFRHHLVKPFSGTDITRLLEEAAVARGIIKETSPVARN